MSAQVDSLGSFAKDELLRFFLHHMSQEQRREIILTYPLTYDALFPGHRPTITERMIENFDVVWVDGELEVLS